jgi:hypothetical protein
MDQVSLWEAAGSLGEVGWWGWTELELLEKSGSPAVRWQWERREQWRMVWNCSRQPGTVRSEQ